MSRLSQLNAFCCMPSWFSSSHLNMLVCKFCSRSLHATDPSYKLPKPHSKKIKQRKNGCYGRNFQCGTFSFTRGSAAGNLATKHVVWHISLEYTNTCFSCLQCINRSDFRPLFCYTIQSFYCHSLSCMLTLHPALSPPSDWLRGYIMKIFASQ